MNNRVSPALIGSFVVSGIVLVVAAVIVFGSGRVFQQRESFVAFFPGSVNGLTVGSNVSFRGLNQSRWLFAARSRRNWKASGRNPGNGGSWSMMSVLPGRWAWSVGCRAWAWAWA